MVIDVHPGEIWDNLRLEEMSESCKYAPLSEQLSQVSETNNQNLSYSSELEYTI